MADRSPLREYYDAQTPSASCVEQLKALEASAEPEPLPLRRRWAKPLTAAALAIFILGVSLWSNSVVNPKPRTETPPVDLAVPADNPALTSVPEGTEPSAADENKTPAEPGEAAPPESSSVDSDEPPAEGDAGSSSGSSFDPFWWLRMGGSSGAGIPSGGWMGSQPLPGSGSFTPPGWGWQGSGNGASENDRGSLEPVSSPPPGNGIGTGGIQPTYYELDGRFYIRLSDQDAVIQVYDMTDLLDHGVYSGPVQFRAKTVWVDLRIAEDGSVSLTVH